MFVDDPDVARPFLDVASIVIVAMDHDTAYELRRAGAANVRLIADYATPHANFDDLYEAFERVVRTRLGRGAEPSLFETLLPDIVRRNAVRLHLRDAVVRALRRENASLVAWRVRDGLVEEP